MAISTDRKPPSSAADRGEEFVAHVRLRIAPGGRRDEVIGRHGEGWKLRVTQPADRGRANDAVRTLLAGIAGVPTAHVDVIAGGSGRDKLVRLRGIDFGTLAGLLDAASGK